MAENSLQRAGGQSNAARSRLKQAANLLQIERNPNPAHWEAPDSLLRICRGRLKGAPRGFRGGQLGGIPQGGKLVLTRNAYFYSTQRGAELDLLLLRRGQRWGFEFKCSDAPRTTKSMHIVMQDLGLAHLWAVYPGDLSYPLADDITALPLKNIGKILGSAKPPVN